MPLKIKPGTGLGCPQADPAAGPVLPRAPHSALGGQHHARPPRHPRDCKTPETPEGRCIQAGSGIVVMAMLHRARRECRNAGPCFLSIGEPPESLAQAGGAQCWLLGAQMGKHKPPIVLPAPQNGPRSSSGAEPHIQPQHKIPNRTTPRPHPLPKTPPGVSTPPPPSTATVLFLKPPPFNPAFPPKHAAIMQAGQLPIPPTFPWVMAPGWRCRCRRTPRPSPRARPSGPRGVSGVDAACADAFTF